MTPTELRCASQHFGPWWVQPSWMAQALSAFRDGMLDPAAGHLMAARGSATDDATEDPGYTMYGSVAKISMIGHMTKGVSSLGGTSTIRTRQAIRKAAADERVRAIMLSIDSPGGTVAGTPDLAGDVAAAGGKPIWAHIDDLGASAAYYVAAGAERVTANSNALVGSIGTVMVLQDASKMAEKEGVKVHVLSTGPNKGTGTMGAEITAEQLTAEQEVVDDLGRQFVDHVNAQRGTKIKMGKGAADGRVFVAGKALGLGLIDAVQTFGQTLLELQATLATQDQEAIARARVSQEGLTL